MSAEILTITPTSGEAPEMYFGVHFIHPLWVEFIDKDYEKWYGCFPSDYPNAFNQVLVDQGSETAFIVAGGIGYLIDINNKNIKYKTQEHPLIVSAIRTSSPGYFIAGTFYSIYIFDSSNLIKEISPDFMIDGIFFKNQIGEKAIGDLATAENQYEYNIDFEFDLVIFELKLIEKPNLVQRLINKWKNK